MARLDDAARLAALHRSGLLRQESRQRLTHVCYTLVQLTDLDASQLNVLDGAYEHNVAVWPEEPPHQPYDAETSGCREVVLAEGLVVVEDTLQHPILCDFPWTDQWRSYLGAPVRFDGQVIGTLCGLSREVRRWSQRDQLAIQTLADLAGHAIVYDQLTVSPVPSEDG